MFRSVLDQGIYLMNDICGEGGEDEGMNFEGKCEVFLFGIMGPDLKIK